MVVCIFFTLHHHHHLHTHLPPPIQSPHFSQFLSLFLQFFMFVFNVFFLVPWESMAAPRPLWQLFVKFGTLIKDSPFYTYTKFHVSNFTSLAPPMGQSWTFVSTRNFWTVWLIFKNEVPLDSLDQDEFNTLYDVIFRLYRFSAISGFIKNLWKPTPPSIFFQSSSKLPYMLFRPSLTKVIEQNFDSHNRLSGRANQNRKQSN